MNVPLPTERLRYFAPGYSSCAPKSVPLNSVEKKPETEKTPAENKPEAGKTVEKTEGVKEEEKKKEATEEEKKKDETTTSNALGELLIGKGIGNALKILRERKLLGQILYSGRAKDKTKEGELEKFKKAGAKGGEKCELDYRDEFGNKMTLKEAFRYQCRIFHGIKPSKRKREKTMIKREKERKKMLMDPVKDSKLMQALARTQQEKGTPFMVLDAKRPGGVSAKQPVIF